MNHWKGEMTMNRSGIAKAGGALWWPRSLAALLLVGALACSVTLISNYDEQIDTAATSLHKEMDAFLTSLDATPQPSYEESQSFYDGYLVELRSVLLRAQSHPKNSQTEQQLELMIRNLGELQEMHKAGTIDPGAVAATRELFNTGWKAIITLEIAKKGGHK